MAITQTRVAVIDDHPILREGIAATLAESGEFQAVASGENLHDAMAIAQNSAPEIILLDINIPGNGFEIAKLLRRGYPAIKIVMFTVSDRSDHLVLALDIGVYGYLLKGATADELLRCLRAVRTGRRYITPELAGNVMGGDRAATDAGEGHAAERRWEFTGRANEVAILLGKGKTNKEIGDSLGISEKTVKHHVTVIMERLNVRNRVEAALVIAEQRKRLL